jgi:separase
MWRAEVETWRLTKQVGIDVVTALTEMEASVKVAPVSPQGPEHLLLALDKNVQAFPWESIPCLRGRPVSRVPSLPVLLDQVALGKIMQPDSDRRKVNSKKTHFILNPSGDLKITQAKFEPYLQDMRERSGWRGSIAQPPTEMEMRQILEGNELVL